ncbi:hypothetical protein P389DRAFT_98105 [Cystobasidium minutum MCA 4210]|uniref:uncharacterized protein n=1 Tax=Cystobasidium minutum MCA 4210 TaxID=1397322 RepID=UPI0034CD7704|eukprot:jgi/Rhomi1/98105/CE98104_273
MSPPRSNSKTPPRSLTTEQPKISPERSSRSRSKSRGSSAGSGIGGWESGIAVSAVQEPSPFATRVPQKAPEKKPDTRQQPRKTSIFDGNRHPFKAGSISNRKPSQK